MARAAMWAMILFGGLCATCAGLYCLGSSVDRSAPRAQGEPKSHLASPPEQSARASEAEDPKWNALRGQFRKMGTAQLISHARQLLHVSTPTRDTIREASMALAFADDRESGRSDVKKLDKLATDEMRALIDQDPVARREMDATVREAMAHQLANTLARDAMFDSVSDREESAGATLVIHGNNCSQGVADRLAAGREGVELKKAGFRRIACIKGAFSFFDADL